MGLRSKLLLPPVFAALLLAGYFHWSWPPRTIAHEEAAYQALVSTAVEAVGNSVAALLRDQRLVDVRRELDAAVSLNPAWTGVALQNTQGNSLYRSESSPERSSADLRTFNRPLGYQGVPLGRLTVRVDFAPRIEALRQDHERLFLTLLLGLAAVTLATGVLVELCARRPLRHLAETAHRLACKQEAAAHPGGGEDEVGRLTAEIAALADMLQRYERDLGYEAGRRQEAEQQLRESEERYAMAVRGADDGLWEWDLKSGEVYYSPRWKTMLGYGGEEVGNSIDEWKSRVHPGDLTETMGRLESHLEGASPRFESDHRLRHKDGRYRWVLARGMAIRSGGGKPYRVVGLNTDITARKRTQEILLALAEGLAAARGEEFFRVLVKNFATVLGVKYAFITECVDSPATRVRKLAVWKDDDFSENSEFDLQGTPCYETVSTGKVCVFRSGVGVRFPRESMWESYLGIPIFDAGGRVIGHLACYNSEPLQEDLPVEPVFILFAVRAGVEMERRLLALELSRARADLTA